jgi:hypothetical protein
VESASSEVGRVEVRRRSARVARLRHVATPSIGGIDESTLALDVTKGTSLSLPPSMPIDEWTRIGRQIFVIADSSAWWLGDWLIYGQSQYPDRYKRAIVETALDYQTLRNYAWVARRYTPGRRRSGLSFQHHAEVAGLPEEDQDRWLRHAEASGWSRNELRSRVRASRAPVGDVEGATDRVLKVHVDLPPTRRRRWSEAASSSDQDLMSWMVSVLDHAASIALAPRSERLEQGA